MNLALRFADSTERNLEVFLEKPDLAWPSSVAWAIAWRITGGIAEIHPPDHPAQLTVNLRSIAGRLTGRCRTSARQTSWTFPPHCRRASAGIIATGSGQSPVSFPSL
jgi:hypothetical protein